MRLRIDIGTQAPVLAWSDVFGPVRAVAYRLIAASDAALATHLHDHGWNGHRLRPVGGSCPQFIGARRTHGRYTTSSKGAIWFGSPIQRISTALLAGLAGRSSLRWGAADLSIQGVELEQLVTTDRAEMRVTTATPVLIKCAGRFAAPDHPDYVAALTHNLRHKADVLGHPSDVEVEVVDAGPMRRFDVGRAPRVGATLSLRIAGDAALLTALYDWGIGLANNQGFGWLR